MAALSIALAAAALLGWARVLWLGARTRRALLRLEAGSAVGGVTAVVPCRNEERCVEAAVSSLLAQDLPGVRVIAVDDRSTDATGAILDRLAARDSRLEVIHVSALPPGWLGKNHACAVGAARARTEWLLFTDGDVVFAPDAIRRAAALAEDVGLGHLAVLPRFVAPGFAERAFVTAFASLLGPVARIWELSSPGTRGAFGVGAFNLVRRADYEAVGGHARIAMEMVDDLKLGLLLRRSGVPQGVADSEGRVAVRWQNGFVASALGLVKNAFAALEYRIGLALAAGALGAFAALAPLLLALLAPSPAARALGAAALALSVLHHATWARRLARGSGAEGILLPPCLLLLSAVVLGSAALARWRGRVVWRGTAYRLEEVRAGCLRIADLPASGAAGWPSRGSRAEPATRVTERSA
ncbi:MAG TPA: glycosyltransferase family 2 protein [Anaeromyxobacter sp.]